MISGLVDHLWQSTLFVAAAWQLTLALRRNRAQVRYWVWFAASVKFLAPLALLVAVGELAPRRVVAPPAQTQWVVVAEEIGQPLTALPSIDVPVSRANRNYLAPAAFAVWTCGFAAIVICWLRRWRRVQALRRSATPIQIAGVAIPVLSTPGLVEPGVFGALRPVLLLPAGIEQRLSPAQLEAILAHELCHVRRRDNLTAAIHMFVQATFWFHPLVWWIGARLVDERERACDEEVLQLGSSPQVYAEGILSVCKLYVESPLNCVSGVTGSDLKKRIEAIMKNRIARKLDAGKKLLLAGAGALTVGLPIMIGVMNAPVILVPTLSAQAPPPVQTSAPTPKFEAVAIRACAERPAGRGGGGSVSGDRLTVACIPVEALIQQAYVTYANGVSPNSHSVPISEGPAWIKSDLYQIEAKAEGSVSREMLLGPMMQTLLEERFKLKIHRETREIPVYALTVAKGGPKLQPLKEGGCLTQEQKARFDAAGRPWPESCSDIIRKGPGSIVADIHGMSLDQAFSSFRFLDRPVVDKTGVMGRFDIHLEFAPDEATPGLLHDRDGNPVPTASDPAGPSIFTAIQEQLGLKLEQTKGPGEFLVIDHVERPSEN